MDVPSRLLGMINIARMKGMAEMEEEVCLAQVAPFNCQKLVEDKKECKLPQHSGRQMMIPLTQQLKVGLIVNVLCSYHYLIHFKV